MVLYIKGCFFVHTEPNRKRERKRATVCCTLRRRRRKTKRKRRLLLNFVFVPTSDFSCFHTNTRIFVLSFEKLQKENGVACVDWRIRKACNTDEHSQVLKPLYLFSFVASLFLLLRTVVCNSPCIASIYEFRSRFCIVLSHHSVYSCFCVVLWTHCMIFCKKIIIERWFFCYFDWFVTGFLIIRK